MRRYSKRHQPEQIAPKRVNRAVRKAADRAGLQEQVYTSAEGKEQMKVTSHVLRHSFAVQNLKNGIDTRTLQGLLGHAKIETTERYLRLAKIRRERRRTEVWGGDRVASVISLCRSPDGGRTATTAPQVVDTTAAKSSGTIQVPFHGQTR